jgi:hypothetical protein
MSHESIIITNGVPKTTFVNDTLKMPIVGGNDTGGKAIALRKANITKSWRNISAALGNNTLSYIFNGVTYPIILQDGYYSYADISAYVQLVQTTNGHYLLDTLGNMVYFLTVTLNPVYYSIDIICTPIPAALTGAYANYTNPNTIVLSGNSPQIIIPNGMKNFLGYLPATYPATPSVTVSNNRSTLVPQLDQVTNVLVHCSWVNNGSSVFPNLIAQINPATTANGSILSYEPFTPIWVTSLGNTQQDISVSFTDQVGNPLKLLDSLGASATIETNINNI